MCLGSFIKNFQSRSFFSKGVNFTAGLPIIRVSPDHGVGYDIAGKNIANTVGSGLELVDQTPFMIGPYVNAAIRSKKNKDRSPEELAKAANKLKIMR